MHFFFHKYVFCKKIFLFNFILFTNSLSLESRIYLSQISFCISTIYATVSLSGIDHSTYCFYIYFYFQCLQLKCTMSLYEDIKSYITSFFIYILFFSIHILFLFKESRWPLIAQYWREKYYIYFFFHCVNIIKAHNI